MIEAAHLEALDAVIRDRAAAGRGLSPSITRLSQKVRAASSTSIASGQQ
jgi:hypothetical protein